MVERKTLPPGTIAADANVGAYHGITTICGTGA
jgi:hypothetical protein